MNNKIILNEDIIREVSIDYLMKTSYGEKLQKAVEIYEKAQRHIFALQEKGGEEELTLIKIGTIISFALLKKYAEGKTINNFSNEDWKAIAIDVSNYAILPKNQQYSMFVFNLYHRYISFWIRQMEGMATEKTLDSIRALADELLEKKEKLEKGNIPEEIYIEDSLWICLEAMIKLLAASVSIINAFAKTNKIIDEKSDWSWVEDFSEAIASVAFEYARYSLLSKEQVMLEEYVDMQYKLDEELEEKYRTCFEKMSAKISEFYEIVDNSFNDDFRKTYISSIKLANTVGVDEAEILDSIDKVDEFFME